MVTTMGASAAIEAKTGLCACKAATEEQQLLIESVDKDVEARILADDAVLYWYRELLRRN